MFVIQIGGVDSEAIILNSLQLEVGAYNPLELASTAVLNLSALGQFTENGVPVDPQALMGRSVEIGWRGFPIFEGRIIAQDTQTVSDSNDLLTTLTAYSAMANLTQYTTGTDSMPEESEGERIIRLAERIWGAPQWIQLPSSMAWNDWDSWGYGTTWDDYEIGWWEPVLDWNAASAVSRTLEASAQDSDLDLMSALSDIAGGTSAWFSEYFWDGTILYSTREDLAERIPRNLDLTGIALAFSAGSTSSLENIYTELTFANQTVEATATDPEAWKKWGRRAYTMLSPLLLEDDLLTQATNRVGALAEAPLGLSRITVDMEQIPSSERAWLSGLEQPRLYNFTGIPATLGGDGEYEIRGISFTGTDTTFLADLLVAPASLFTPFTTWRATSPSLVWNNYPPTITWENAA